MLRRTRIINPAVSNSFKERFTVIVLLDNAAAIAAALSRSTMTVKRSLNELETAGLIMRVRRGVGEPNRIYVLTPGEDEDVSY